MERVTYYQCALFPVLAAARLAVPRRALRDAEDRVPPLVNALLTVVNSLEARAARWINVPWGSSLVVRARSPV